MDFNATRVSIFIQDNSLGDYSSIIALFITVGGFIITIIKLNRTKKASETATAAVSAIRNDLKKIDTVANLSSVLAEMEEIKRLYREKNHIKLPERYSKLRASLISIKSSNSTLIEEDFKILQGAIAQLKASEKILDQVLDPEFDSKSTTFNISKSNGVISNHIDKLQEVLIRVKSTIGDNP